MDAWTLLTQRLRTNASGPFVTFVDDVSRVELSATTVENGAAKVANALLNEFDLESGALVWLDIPPHWQRTVWCAGVWAAGCAVMVTGDAHDADLVVTSFASAEHLAATVSAPITVVSLHPFGLAHTEPLPAGCTDATVAVRQQPDILLSRAAAHDSPALVSTDKVLAQDEVLATAAHLAESWALTPGGRLLTDGSTDITTSWLASFAVPLVSGSSVVIANSGIPLAAEGITAIAV